MISIAKPGYDHLFQGKNCQDFGCIFSNVKMVMDGCGSGSHSEVGAKIFGQMMKTMDKKRVYPTDFRVKTEEIFNEIVSSLGNLVEDEVWKTSFLLNNFCFTIIGVIESSFSFEVLYCGDGYILTIDNKGNLELVDLDEEYGNAPPYFVYNYIKPEYLLKYREGVSFKKKVFYKNKYRQVGAATDGIKYVDKLIGKDKEAFKEAIFLGKQGKLGQIINRNEKVFKDDICIVM